MTDEQKALMRHAAQTLLEHVKAGRKADPAAIAWAEHWARWQPAQRQEVPASADMEKMP